MREKKRYVLVKIDLDAERELDEQTAKRILSQSVLEMLGQAGAAEAAFAIKAFEPKSKRAVVKCSAKSLERVVAALALKRKFEGGSVAVRVERVAGSFSPSKDGFPAARRYSRSSVAKHAGARK